MNAKKLMRELGISKMSFGLLLHSIRVRDGISLVAMAEKLKISKAKLCDIEKGRRHIGLEKAVEFAKKLNDSPDYFLKVIINEQLSSAGLDYECELKSA